MHYYRKKFVIMLNHAISPKGNSNNVQGHKGTIMKAANEDVILGWIWIPIKYHVQNWLFLLGCSELYEFLRQV